MARNRNLHVFPTAVALLAPATFLLTYGIAVYDKDVAAIFPYVSSTGTVEPESYIFSQLLNITAFLLAACVYGRHLYVKSFARFKRPKGRTVNRVATTIGFISCLGLDMVANFQVSKCPPVHYLGSFLCFFGGIVYFFLETTLSHHMANSIESRSVYFWRLGLCGLALAAMILTCSTGFLAKSQFNGTEQRKWSSTDGGYGLHVISAAAEWLLIVFQGCLVLTFLPAFKCVTIKPPVVIIDGLSPIYIYVVGSMSNSVL